MNSKPLRAENHNLRIDKLPKCEKHAPIFNTKCHFLRKTHHINFAQLVNHEKNKMQIKTFKSIDHGCFCILEKLLVSVHY